MHVAPDVLPRLTGAGPGGNRYDDPRGIQPVRYCAENLTGALLETMARFRPAPEAEALLTAVTGVEPGDVEHLDPADGLADWLNAQRIGRLTDAAQPLVDVHDPQRLAELDKHPLVRDQLDRSTLGTSRQPARLDEAIVRLAGPIGRPITQAVSAAIREWFPDVAGIAYRSRLDDEEWCWALWSTTAVYVELDLLSPDHRHHRRAFERAARVLQVQPPPAWL